MGNETIMAVINVELLLIYMESDWNVFENIVEYDPTGISKPALSSDIKEVYRSTASGQLLKAPAKGLNIVKYSDGSARKEIVREKQRGMR